MCRSKGYELLKGLSGVSTHEHEERVPILENSQDYEELAAELVEVLANVSPTRTECC